MTISANQLLFFLSGGQNNTNPNLSLGGSISSALVSGTINNLFSNISSEEASSGRTDYRCVYLKNSSATDSIYDAGAYVSSQSSGGSTATIGLSATPINTVAPLLAVETIVPSGVSFQDSSVDNRINIGTMGPLSFVPVWIRRVTMPGTSFKEYDNFVLKFVGRPFP